LPHIVILPALLRFWQSVINDVLSPPCQNRLREFELQAGVSSKRGHDTGRLHFLIIEMSRMFVLPLWHTPSHDFQMVYVDEQIFRLEWGQEEA
jgi:hypothetical protein